MRRAALGALGIAVVIGCQLPQQQAQTPPPQPYYPPQPYPYPPQPYPQQPYPTYAPTQTAPPVQPPAPPPQPAPAPTTPPAAPSTQPYNPWANLLQNLLKGGAPPLPQWPLPWPQPQPSPTPQPGIDARGLDLANAINAYRQQNGLQPIPISKALSKVGDTHVHDLATSPPMAATCNDHSWTNRGSWTACCYTPDNAQAKCMWYKPSEVASFNATGYEISIGQPGVIQPGLVMDSKQAITFWSGSQLHNDVMLNKGQWATMTWKAMGAGIIDSHASAWFSDTADPTP